MAYLVVTMDGKELCRRELTGPVTLGRSTECDVWINDAGISRRHCRVERNGHAWEIVDLGSRNGVVLHGERVAKHALKDGESVHVGAARVTFHADSYVASRPTRPTMPRIGDSISDTVVNANELSHISRALPTPRAKEPAGLQPSSSKKRPAPLAFARPPAQPKPVASESSEDDGNGKHDDEPRPPRLGLFRRFLQK